MLGQIASFVAARSANTTNTMARCAWGGATRCSHPTTTSSSMTMRTLSSRASPNNHPSQQQQQHVENTFIVETDQGRTFRVMDTRKFPPVKPGLINSRLAKMKTFVGTQKDIRHSPWRLNLICQMIAKLPVPEALKQLEFSEKSRAPLVQALLQKTVNRATLKEGLVATQLEVAECFVTKGTPLKRIKPMARGRYA